MKKERVELAIKEALKIIESSDNGLSKLHTDVIKTILSEALEEYVGGCKKKPKLGSLWYHKVKKRYYEVVVIANDQENGNYKYWPEIIVYKDYDSIWARPLSEFLDKFEEV